MQALEQQAFFFQHTKIRVPEFSGTLCQRSRLYPLFESHPTTRLVYLKAPAGFGKTTAILDYCQHKCIKPYWLSLDEYDNDYTVLFAYIIYCLAKPLQLTALSEQIAQGTPIAASELCTQLKYAINRYQGPPIVWVLDDLHRIQDKALLAQLWPLIALRNPSMTIIISSRDAPTWPIAKWQLDNECQLIDFNHLAFRDDEAEHFFTQHHLSAIASPQIAIINQKLEGWAVGLKMASLRPHTFGDWQTMSVDDPLLADYLTQEVFLQQPSEVQRFLMYSSLFEPFNLELLDYCLPTGDNTFSVAQLQHYIHRQSLLIIPLGQGNYRYHHLFQYYLQQQCLIQYPTIFIQLCLKAATYWLQKKAIDIAFQYLLKSRDTHALAEQLQQHGWYLYHYGHFQILQRCYQHLHPIDFTQYPRCTLLLSWYFFTIRSDIQTAKFLTRQLESLQPTPSDELAYELGRLQAHIALEQGHFEQAQQLAAQALHLSKNQTRKSGLYTLLGENALNAGQLEQAFHYYQTAIQEAHYKNSWDLHQLGVIYYQQGELTQALRQFELVQTLDSQHTKHSFNLMCGLFAMAQIYLDLGWFEKAQHTIQQAEQVRLAFNPRWQLPVLSLQIKWYLLQNQAVSPECISQSLDLLQQYSFHPYTESLAHEALLMCDYQHQATGITEYLAKQPLHTQLHSIHQHHEQRNRILARWPHDKEACQQALNQALQAAQRDGLHYQRLQHALLSLLIKEHTTPLLCQQQLIDVLTHSEQQGLIGPYLTPWARSIDLSAFELKENQAFTQRIQQLQQRHRQRKSESSMPDCAAALALSSKEWQILQYLIAQHSNQQIADTLFISLGTVKSHINRLYKKLQVSTRQQAIIQGQKLLQHSDGGLFRL